MTYGAGPWVRDLSRICDPLVVVTMLVREGAIEYVADVSHGVYTNS